MALIIGIFHDAVEWLGDIASNHPSLPETFADHVFERLQATTMASMTTC